MNKAAVVIVLLLGAYYALQNPVWMPGPGIDVGGDETALSQAIENRGRDVQVRGAGKVVRILSDDNDGSRHQRFILELDSGDTLLVAHNIDLAPRVPGIRIGDSVEFHGVYEWNDRGGVIHWTHHDPRGQHTGGWLKHQGRTYQ